MAIPAITQQVVTEETWTEDWSGGFRGDYWQANMWQAPLTDLTVEGVNNTDATQIEPGAHPNVEVLSDQILGSFLRMGRTWPRADHPGEYGWAGLHTRTFWDPAHPASCSFKMRFGAAPDADSYGCGFGSPYTGEAVCRMMWSEGDNGMSRSFSGSWPGADIPYGTVIDVQVEYLPSGGSPYDSYVRCRISTDGGATWRDWIYRNNVEAGTPGGRHLRCPFSWYWYIGDNAYLDIGAVTFTGKPMCGAGDFIGWTGRWDLTDVAVVSYGEGVNPIGGVVGRDALGAEVYNINLEALGVPRPLGETLDADWIATSPIYAVPAGQRVRNIKLELYNGLNEHAGAEPPRVFVRYASDGSLVPDSIVTGNSAGLTAGTEWAFQPYFDSSETARAFLREILPVGVIDEDFYLEVAGTSHALGATMVTHHAEPRAGGVWVGWEPYSSEPVGTGPVRVGAQRHATDAAGALRIRTSQGVIGVALQEPDATTPVRVRTGSGTYGLVP